MNVDGGWAVSATGSPLENPGSTNSPVASLTAEIAPAKVRGRLVGLVQFNIVLGILLAYLSNTIVRSLVDNPVTDWRWMFGVMAVPSAIFLFMLFIVWQLARESKAGRLGTFVLFFVLAFGMLGFIAKSIIQKVLGL